MASILKGLHTQKAFRKFYYKHNVFMQESLEALKPILLRQAPNHLQELTLVSCTTNQNIIEQLTDELLEEAYSIQKIGLISMQVSELALNNIGTIVKQSIWLESLDISWTSLTADCFKKFLGCLKDNRNLKWLNLSHNTLVDGEHQHEKGDMSVFLLSKNSMFKPI